jgi:hypothetical protein
VSNESTKNEVDYSRFLYRQKTIFQTERTGLYGQKFTQAKLIDLLKTENAGHPMASQEARDAITLNRADTQDMAADE